MCLPGQPPGPPASAGEAVEMVRAGLAFVAEADVASLPTALQAELLRGLERAESAHTAARAHVLGVFAGQLGFEDDGHRGARSWLMWQTRVTQGAAGGAVGWARRLPAHPLVGAALVDGQVSASWARQVCDWSDLLPAARRASADQILLAAAAGGAQLADLSGLAEEMYRRIAQPDTNPDDTPGDDGPALRAAPRTATPTTASRSAPAPVAAIATVVTAAGTMTGSGTGWCSWTCISVGRGG